MKRRHGFVALAAAAVLSGCESTPPDFPPHLSFPPRTDRLILKVPDRFPAHVGDPGKLDDELAGLDAMGGRTFDPSQAPADQRQALDRFLVESFGSPAAPALNGEAAAGERLGLTPERLAEGGRLYRRHCLQCHGLSGDGRGPTGLWIYPHPRDFRRGSFKFVSTGDGGKPRRADLTRTITDGLKGTAMPAFALLEPEKRELMAGFVTYLAVRGQVEFQTLVALANEGADGVDGDAPAYARERLTVALGEWLRAESLPSSGAVPAGFDEREGPTHDESLRRGFALFASQAGAGCASCHENFGRTSAYRYDVWGTVVRPADLTARGYKGGGRAEDLFARVRGGIAPAGMPAHPTLSDAQVWDLVRFVRSMPYPRELPEDVRKVVYPK